MSKLLFMLLILIVVSAGIITWAFKKDKRYLDKISSPRNLISMLVFTVSLIGIIFIVGGRL